MNNLFMPKEQKSLNDLIKPKFKDKPVEDEVLVCASDQYIFALDDSFEESSNFVTRSDTIFNLCVHKGVLFDCGTYGIRRTHDSAVIYDGGIVNVMAFHDNDIYFSDGIGNLLKYDGKSSGKQVGYQRGGPIYVMHEHNGILYEGGTDKTVNEALTGNFLTSRSDTVHGLYSFGDTLLDAGCYNGVIDTFSNHYFIDDPQGCGVIFSLFGYNNALHCFDGDGKIFDLESGTQVYKFDPTPVSVVPVPKKALEGLL